MCGAMFLCYEIIFIVTFISLRSYSVCLFVLELGWWVGSANTAFWQKNCSFGDIYSYVFK